LVLIGFVTLQYQILATDALFLFIPFKKIVVIAPQAFSVFSFVDPVECGQAVD
jgi:hypothetical protein